MALWLKPQTRAPRGLTRDQIEARVRDRPGCWGCGGRVPKEVNVWRCKACAIFLCLHCAEVLRRGERLNHCVGRQANPVSLGVHQPAVEDTGQRENPLGPLLASVPLVPHLHRSRRSSNPAWRIGYRHHLRRLYRLRMWIHPDCMESCRVAAFLEQLCPCSNQKGRQGPYL